MWHKVATLVFGHAPVALKLTFKFGVKTPPRQRFWPFLLKNHETAQTQCLDWRDCPFHVQSGDDRLTLGPKRP